MASHPLNLALRFLLELATWFSVGAWAYAQADGLWRWPAGLGASLVLMVCWGVFAVPNDPSRGGTPVIVVSGGRRLELEITEFTIGAWALYGLGHTLGACAFVLLVVLHHVLSWDRLSWLLEQ